MKPLDMKIIERVEVALSGKPGVSVNADDLRELIRIAKEYNRLVEEPRIAAVSSSVDVEQSTVVSNVTNSNIVVGGNARVGQVLNLASVRNLTIE